MCGKMKSCVPWVFGVFDDFNDFGDDVAAALNFDPVEKLEAEALDEVGVVEGGAADGGAADEGGVSSATGVSLPVRPTCTVISRTWVMPDLAVNL